ncbi:uncharacterized protein UV8b_00985 [Ustilaginoidea virens]|uniref:Uncharacterized protein n=1 Tax=Ustilaginoidea virens TaxID=1159556 RepID=A0A8E5HJQ9_USTVR|nr:uncharacterized protein UV8b_00985 [Ustilaginoidea virens]QUC16744.1 hypothetical protein UV8b_00985 [Ustilaginoidea virens]
MPTPLHAILQAQIKRGSKQVLSIPDEDSQPTDWQPSFDASFAQAGLNANSPHHGKIMASKSHANVGRDKSSHGLCNLVRRMAPCSGLHDMLTPTVSFLPDVLKARAQWQPICPALSGW